MAWPAEGAYIRGAFDDRRWSRVVNQLGCVDVFGLGRVGDGLARDH